MQSIKFIISLLVLIVFSFSCTTLAEAAATTPPYDALEGNDKMIVDRFIEHAVNSAKKMTPEAVEAQCRKSPEMFAWVEFKNLGCLNIAYELTGDTKYLDLFRDTFKNFRNVMTAEHDEYLGWYGLTLKNRQPKDNPNIQIDEIQSNFRGMWALANWVELARSNPEYAAANKETIDAYIDLMENHIFPKWDSRGHFSEIPGRGGVYHGLDFPLKGQPTLSHEKLSIMVEGLLALYRVTKNPVYMKRALQIGTWYKSCLTIVDDHYEWMSWAAAGKWDIHPTKEDAWKVGWIAPDPNAAWYITSMSIALNLYQHGLLFDETDIERFVQTQKTMCWNGDMENPEYRNVAGQTSKWIKGRFLSAQLANYDKTLATLAFYGPHETEQLEKSTSGWHGGTNAQSYVKQKYIIRPKVLQMRRPYFTVGERFLNQGPGNRSYYEGLYFKVEAPGCVPALKPSEMFGDE